MRQFWERSLAWLVQTFFVALFIGGAIYVIILLLDEVRKLNTNNAHGELVLPALVIVGVLVMVISLGMMSVAFSFRNMTDRSQALGLPEGSIRAVVALLLVVLFAIVAISLYTSLSQGTIDQINNLSEAQKNAIVDKFPSEIVGISQTPTTTPATGPTAPPTFTVWHRSPASVASQDFAKQLLVLIGTLVTAVASFYFGANSVASAAAAVNRGVTPDPVIQSITPNTIPRGSVQSLTLAGQNLGSINGVTLSSGTTNVSATNVLRNATTVRFDVTIDPNATTGQWTVTAIDESGTQTTSPVKLTVQ